MPETHYAAVYQRPTRKITSDELVEEHGMYDDPLYSYPIKEGEDPYYKHLKLSFQSSHTALHNTAATVALLKLWRATSCLDRSWLEKLDDPYELWSVGPVVQEFGKDAFKSRVVSELDAEPVEDGVVHSTEGIIHEAFTNFSLTAGEWTQELFDELLVQGKSSQAAGVLQCLGRLRLESLKEVGRKLVTKGLKQEDPAIREAATSVIEQWGDAQLLEILRHQQEDPVPWLASYMKRVIQDLSETRF